MLRTISLIALLFVFSLADAQIVRRAKKAVTSTDERVLLFDDGSWSSLSNQHTLEKDELQKIYDQHQRFSAELTATRGVSPYRAIREQMLNGQTPLHVDFLLKSYNGTLGVAIYSLENDTFTLLLEKAQELVIIKQPITEDSLNALIASTTEYIKKGHTPDSLALGRGLSVRSSANPEQGTAAYQRLSSLLFPFVSDFTDLDHLVIVPTGGIATLPLSAFKLDNTYLLDLFSYSISPNLSEVVLMARENYIRVAGDQMFNNHFFDDGFLLIGNPVYPSNSDTPFPNLPGAEEEVNAIAQKLDKWGAQFSGQVYDKYIREEASESLVADTFQSYSLVHIASHAISSSESALDESYILLTPSDSNDGYWTAREIQALWSSKKYNASPIVILSACQTGLGQSHQGGVIGLSRAFIYSGASYVISSLWPINDAKTKVFFELFYRHILAEDGTPTDPIESLFETMKYYQMNVDDDPTVWAAFTIMGMPAGHHYFNRNRAEFFLVLPPRD